MLIQVGTVILDSESHGTHNRIILWRRWKPPEVLLNNEQKFNCTSQETLYVSATLIK
jgi:hypothetical protein